MIFGELGNLAKEKVALSPVLQKGLAYLQNTDLENLSVGRHDIDGDCMFVSVSEYQAEPKENRQPESHQKYIDIQYVARGEEVIGCSFISPRCEIARDEIQERDLIFYKTAEQEVDIVLIPGRYAIFFPNDVHRPGCIHTKEQAVKKIVIKIAVSLVK